MAVVPWIATVVTILLFGSHFINVRHFRLTGTTGSVPYIPLAATLVNCAFWAKYGILWGDPSIYAVNLIGLCFTVYCMLAYYYYSANRRHVERVTLYTVGGIFVVLLYVKLNHTVQTRNLLGTLAAIGSISMYGSPLVSLAQVVKTKDTASLSFPFAVLSATACCLWTAYGFQRDDKAMIVPNFLGAVLAFAQLFVFAIYRNARPSTS